MILAVRVLYNLLLPVFCVVAAPAWILRMARRGGLSRHLWERLGFYDRPAEIESGGGVYLHAVSVGEVMIALKLIAQWRQDDAEEQFVLAATTSTGFQVATEKAPEGVRVIYSPVDFPFLIRGLFRRFKPRLIVLVDSELWPNMLDLAHRREIPVALVNARLSPRSARRYARFKAVTAPLLQLLKLVCAQAEEHRVMWQEVGVPENSVVVTGSVKFDLEHVAAPKVRADFQHMLDAFGAGRPVVLAASTHAGEEVIVAEAVKTLPGALAVLLPRHAERRREVQADLERAGFAVVLRSDFSPPRDPVGTVLVVDSTGELGEWTAHADVVVIGKSFLARGGQNPTEAIAARIPVVCGPNMENFEPLISELRAASGVRTVKEGASLAEAIASVLNRARDRKEMVQQGSAVLERHRGATARTVALLKELGSGIRL
jgi:3-deoxy-D-manno-octulosonic-acid transferase